MNIENCNIYTDYREALSQGQTDQAASLLLQDVVVSDVDSPLYKKAMQIEQELSQGRSFAAAKLMDEETDLGVYIVAKLRFLVLTAQYDAAINYVAKETFDPDRTGQLLAELTLLRAYAEFKLGNLATAQALLVQTIELCIEQDAWFAFRFLNRESILELFTLAPALYEEHLGEIEHRLSEIFPVTLELPDITERELELLEKLSSTDSVPQIAKDLFISEDTARTHIKAIYRKLEVHTREKALSKAQRLGLI